MKLNKNNESLDNLLKESLHTEKMPDEALHQLVMHKWKENKNMAKKRYKVAVASIVGVLAFSAISVGAAMHFLPSNEVATQMGEQEIAELFKGDNAVEINQTQVSDLYSFTLMGMTEGENLTTLDTSEQDIKRDHFYAVIAIANKDGSDLNNDEFLQNETGYFISPLIQGLQPWMYNIASMNGSYSQVNKDGVVYRMIDCDDISYFSDKELYLCISNTAFYDTEAYNYDDQTGKITPNKAYTGTNLLFTLPIDKKKADPEKAAQYLKELQNSWDADATKNEADVEKAQTESAGNVFLDRNKDYLNSITNPLATVDYRTFIDSMDKSPDDADTILLDLGMESVDQQTLTAEDGIYTFKQVVDDECVNNFDFRKDQFVNGMDFTSMFEESNNESDIIIILLKLNEDNTATATLYKKVYKNE